MLSVEPSVGREWNDELAGFRQPEAGRSPSAGLPGPRWNHPMAETAESEVSVGRDRGTSRIPSQRQNS
jgi:hypothetical protein